MEREELIKLVEKLHVTCHGCGEEGVIERHGKPAKWVNLFGRFFFCQNCTDIFFSKLKGFTSP